MKGLLNRRETAKRTLLTARRKGMCSTSRKEKSENDRGGGVIRSNVESPSGKKQQQVIARTFMSRLLGVRFLKESPKCKRTKPARKGWKNDDKSKPDKIVEKEPV